MTFEQYHRAADIFGFVDYLASARSNFVSVHTLGQSVEGRPIKMIKISSGKPNATAFWIDGGKYSIYCRPPILLFLFYLFFKLNLHIY